MGEVLRSGWKIVEYAKAVRLWNSQQTGSVQEHIGFKGNQSIIHRLLVLREQARAMLFQDHNGKQIVMKFPLRKNFLFSIHEKKKI